MPPKKEAIEEVEFLLQVIASAGSDFKPNYNTVASNLGINTANNAQRRFKGLVERHGYNLVQNAGVVKTDTGTPTTPGDAATTPTPKPRKRGRPSKVQADNTDETPTKKSKTDAGAIATNGEEDEEEDMEVDETS